MDFGTIKTEMEPVDHITLQYVRLTGRGDDTVCSFIKGCKSKCL